MITCYFGIPGCGKTTLLTKLAIEGRKKNILGKRKYKEVYTINFEVNDCIRMKFEDLKNYKVEDSLILIDEITLDADNRNYKTFPPEIRDFILLHRHLGVDIVYATQNYEKVDKVIRDTTQELWYMTKSILPFFKRYTKAQRIYRKININEHTSELTMGYRFCTFIESIMTSNIKIINRNKYYKYFDSYDQLNLKDRPYYQNERTKIERKKSKLIERLEKWKNKRKKILKF